MTSKNEDLFDGVTVPREETKPEPDTKKPDETPDGVPATRLAAIIVPILGIVAITIAWSISVWILAAVATAIVIGLAVLAIVHGRRKKTTRTRRRQRSRATGIDHLQSAASPASARGGVTARLKGLARKAGIGGKNSATSDGASRTNGRNGSARGGKLNPRNWGKNRKNAGHTSGKSAARSGGINNKKGGGKSAGAGGRARGSASTRNATGSAMGKPKTGLNGNKIANQAGKPKRRRNRTENSDTDSAETTGPGLISRARQRRRDRKTKQLETTTETEKKTTKQDAKKDEKPQVKDEYAGIEFPFDDAGFPVNIPNANTTTPAPKPDPGPPIDDMGFPMYPDPDLTRKPTPKIGRNTTMSSKAPSQILRENYQSHQQKLEDSIAEYKKQRDQVADEMMRDRSLEVDVSGLKKLDSELDGHIKTLMGRKRAYEDTLKSRLPNG